MFFYTSPIGQTREIEPLELNYYSVEFPLHGTQPVYQFKLWQSEQNSFFLLAKDGSDLISQLKVGHIMPMKYYSEDALRSTEIRDTRIIEIINETKGRFRGHYRIELGIVGHS